MNSTFHNYRGEREKTRKNWGQKEKLDLKKKLTKKAEVK
jgi:hypothetical protein